MKTKFNPCPYCGAPNNQCAVLENNRGEDPKPREGDLSLCNSCGGTLRFNEESLTDKLDGEHLDDYPELLLCQLFASSLFVKRKVADKELKERKE